MTISDIFKNNGENYFRNVETKCLKFVSKNDGIIVSTGGGIVKRAENIKSQDEKIFNVDVINENKEIIELPEIKSESWIKHLINRIFKIFK